MIGLLVFKEKLKQFYGKYNIYIVPVVKFLVGFLTFWLINANVGFMSKLKNPLIPVVMGLVASFIPYGVTAFLAGVFILIHVAQVSLEIALVIFVFVLAVTVLYYGFRPSNTTPICGGRRGRRVNTPWRGTISATALSTATTWRRRGARSAVSSTPTPRATVIGPMPSTAWAMRPMPSGSSTRQSRRTTGPSRSARPRCTTPGTNGPSRSAFWAVPPRSSRPCGRSSPTARATT